MDKSFRFDHIFGESDGQAAVFEQLLPVLESAVNGFNATIFTYGQVSFTDEYFFHFFSPL